MKSVFRIQRQGKVKVRGLESSTSMPMISSGALTSRPCGGSLSSGSPARSK